VSEERDLAALRSYYELGAEKTRLRTAPGAVEHARMKIIIARDIPRAPATIADIGGGPGAYTLWLCGHGYQVEHRDLMPIHVEEVLAAAGSGTVRSAVANARALDLGDATVDAVLLLGPIYHLRSRADRLQVLREARRIARPGAPIFIAAISRWSTRLHGILKGKLYERFESHDELRLWLDAAERSGHIEPRGARTFSGYGHRPRQFRAEVAAAGLDVAALVAVDGVSFLLDDVKERMSDPTGQTVLLETIAALEGVPELIGVTHQMLITARRPAAD
jgi:SAM-dependent methyltransferase